MRQFKQSGEVPPVLRTEIRLQTKSWAKIRKILLAPPGERIAMPGQRNPGQPACCCNEILYVSRCPGGCAPEVFPVNLLLSTGENGNVLPATSGVVSEAIEHGQGGLRVEVSLKYRRLLVQQLKKHSLLSAKDYDSFE